MRPGTQNANPSQEHAASGILNSDADICLIRNVCPSLDLQLASRLCLWVPRRSADLLLFIFSLPFGQKNDVAECKSQKNLRIVDLTGAGDLFAAGFLHGHVNNLSLKESLEKGTEMSSKIIQKIGARLN